MIHGVDRIVRGYGRRIVSAPAFDGAAWLAARTLTWYFAGDDYLVTSANPTRWLGRASAGSSGDGKRWNRSQCSSWTGYGGSCVDWTAITKNGKRWLEADAANGSQAVIMNAAESDAFTPANAQSYGNTAYTLTMAARYDAASFARPSSGFNGAYSLGTSNYYGLTGVGVRTAGKPQVAALNAAGSAYQVAESVDTIAAGTYGVHQVVLDTGVVLKARFVPEGVDPATVAWASVASATQHVGSSDRVCLMGANASTTATFRGAVGAIAMERAAVDDATANLYAAAIMQIAGIE